MISFKLFLLEYLTDAQRKSFAHISMTDKARADTDHFFGKDNDIVHGEISIDAGHHEHKSEVHRAVERHIGQEIHHDDYRRGIIKDKYGRDVKIGRLIKDKKLRDAFASDSTREGSRKGSIFKTSTVRGIEVAGQTNSAPDPHHPKGHSWAQLSCKNVDDGTNRYYLENEIRHGTVVHRIHDHTGQEIYRATLQPHHNERGDVAYSVDSEYGIKHPVFTRSSHKVAKKLSGEYKPGIFVKHAKVYDNNSQKYILHPDTTEETLHKLLKHSDVNIRIATIQHPNITPEHISTALEDKDKRVREIAAYHLKASSDHLHKALNDKDFEVRMAAASNKNANAEHLHKALNDRNYIVRRAATSNPNANTEHLHKALHDNFFVVREAAASHPNANAEHLHKALNDNNEFVRYAAINNSNVNAEHLHKALNDENERVRKAAKENPNYRKYFNDHVQTISS
jgi:hypothetical protein